MKTYISLARPVVGGVPTRRLLNWRPGWLIKWARKSTRNLAVLIAAALILVGVVAVGVSNWSSDTYDDLELIGFDADRVMAVESKLCSWPTRHTGTIYEGKAAQYIATEFEAAGLKNVHIEEYEEVEYEVLGASLQLVHYTNGPLGLVPDPRREPLNFEHKVDFVVQGFSGSRAASSGPTAFLDDLEYVGIEDNGTEASHYSPAAGRAVVVPTDPDVTNYDIYHVAHEAGVAALIVHNLHIHENIGFVPISKSSPQPDGWPDPEYPDIPFVMVSKEVGDTILATPNAKLRLHVDVDIGMRTVHVVVGEVRGQGDTKEFIVIGAHHDCVYVNTGAIDNGSGTTAVIELAHQLAEAKVERTIRFCTYGGEEDGIYGSHAYVAAHREETKRHCAGVLNLDMSHVNLQRDNRGWVTPDNDERRDVIQAIIDDVYEAQPDLEDRFDYQISIMEHPHEVGTDSMPFAKEGVETINFWGSGAWEYHTYRDNLDHFMPEGLEMAVLIAGSYALWLADNA